MKGLRVNFDRLRDDINQFAKIGQSPDGGIYRMAFTGADMEARRELIKKLKEAGLENRMDGAANVWGRIPGMDGNPSVVMGSHVDTVPAAGHLDGALGVLVALECLRRIKEENIKPTYPVEMVAFSDEEGRFGGLFGSQALAGDISPETILKATDLSGFHLNEAMKTHGLDPMDALNARRAPESLKGYLELHIEQGPVLDANKLQAGVVEEITGLFKWTIRLIGQADHAGTTPMPMRKDAFLGVAEFTHEIPRILEEYGGDHSVATVGKIDLFPGTANTVPGKVEFSLDVRDTSSEVLEQLQDAIRRALSAIARRRSLMFEFDIVSEVSPVQCDPVIVNIIDKTAEEHDIRKQRMPSGAAHDAQIMAKITPVGMIFVPSVGGRSHSPAEWTHWEDIEQGANLALNSLLKLAEAS